MKLGTFGDLAGIAKIVTDQVQATGGVVLEMANRAAREVNEALPILKALGLSVRDLHARMAGMPEIRFTVVGAVEAIEPNKLKSLIEGHADKTLLVAVLQALRLAAGLKDQLGDLGFRGVVVTVTVGLPPNIDVSFVSDVRAQDLAA